MSCGELRTEEGRSRTSGDAYFIIITLIIIIITISIILINIIVILILGHSAGAGARGELVVRVQRSDGPLVLKKG